MTGVVALWHAIAATPAFGLALTVGVYALVRVMAARLGGAAWANPVLWTLAVVVAVLLSTGTRYSDYMRGGSVLSLLLGPAIVALALPIYLNARRLARVAGPVVLSTALGASVGIAAAIAIAGLLGGVPATVLALAPTHATSPVASAVSELAGGPGSLAATMAILTGVVGAVAGPTVLDALRIRDPHARGLAYGLSSHAIGTARAFEEGPIVGAFAATGMALGAACVAVLVPLSLLVPAFASWAGR